MLQMSIWALTTTHNMPLPATLSAAIGSTANSSSEEQQSKEVLANRYLVERTLGSGNCGTAILVTDRKEKDAKNKLWVLSVSHICDFFCKSVCFSRSVETKGYVHQSRWHRWWLLYVEIWLIPNMQTFLLCKQFNHNHPLRLQPPFCSLTAEFHAVTVCHFLWHTKHHYWFFLRLIVCLIQLKLRTDAVTLEVEML